MFSQKNKGLKEEILAVTPQFAGIEDYYKYEGFHSSEGQPMTIRRARAFESLLRQCEKHIYQNDSIAGSTAGLAAPVKDEELQSKIGYVQQFGERNFLTYADHAAPNHRKLMRTGIGGLIREAEVSLDRIGQDDPEGENKAAFLQSVLISLKAFSRYILAYADQARALMGTDGYDSAELGRMQDVCTHIATSAPETFEQALTLTNLLYTAFRLEGRYAMVFGRMDQYLIDFYRRDCLEGRLSEKDAVDMLAQVFLKIGERKRLLGGDDVANICIGGLTPEGADGTNELSYCIIEAVKQVQIPGPNLTARMHPGTPDKFYLKCLDCLRTGIGYPSMTNDGINVTLLERRGYRLEDARDFCFAGCIENFVTGKQPPWSDSRYDTPKYLELALNDGADMLTGEQKGLHTGNPAGFQSFDEFLAAFQEQCVYGVTRHMDRYYSRWIQNPMDFTSPFLSAFFDDCIARGKDINDGGTVYPCNFGVAVMGLGTVVDSLAAVKKLVYEDKTLTMELLVEALKADFIGHENVRKLLLSAPKYGNDDEYADGFARWLPPYFQKLFDRYQTPDGGFVWIGMAANVSNIASGEITAATPDGRRAGAPLSDAASPTYGADRLGPTAVIHSVSKPDYTYSEVGSVVNQKYSPALFAGDERLNKMAALVKTYFQMGGQEIQINIVEAETLRDAIRHPEKHAGLMVRVSGFSARFVELDRAVQLDIIARTEHQASGGAA